MADEKADYTLLKGGRTNRLWRFDHSGDTFVCKLFQNGATPLFPNDPGAEATALSHLTGTGLATDFLARIDSEMGTVLVYRHIPGPCWAGDVTAVASLLNRLHATPPPTDLRHITTGANAILAHGANMLNPHLTSAKHLMRLKPSLSELSPPPNVFLHGDVVAQNLIEGPDGLRFIDWQCPAIGDPTEDLAIFLSPAMQHIYRQRVLSPTEETSFLDGYGHKDRSDRYRHLAPAYHWRMAAYCLWKVEQGDAIYQQGFEKEIAWLERS